LGDKKNYKGIILPKENADEAAVIEGVDILPADNLKQVVDFINGEIKVNPVKIDIKSKHFSSKIFIFQTFLVIIKYFCIS